MLWPEATIKLSLASRFVGSCLKDLLLIHSAAGEEECIETRHA